MLAGRFPRVGANSELWFLPEGADIVAWAITAIGAWRSVDTERFPAPADWRTADEWRSENERAAAARLRPIEEERGAALAALAVRESHAQTELAAASEEADATERRLITDQGPTLVNEVIMALTDLGFEVLDMDLIHSPSPQHATSDARQMTDQGQEGKDPRRDHRTWPTITDFACCSLASLGAVVALTAVVVLVIWHAGPSNKTTLAAGWATRH